MVGGKNSDIFIMLRLNVLFRMKSMIVLSFHQHINHNYLLDN